MDKAALKDRMLALEAAELAAAREHYLEHVRGARMEDEDSEELDAQSRAEYEGELAAAFDHPVHNHEEKLHYLQGLDFGPKAAVEEGAVVQLGQRHFVIAVATAAFEHEGTTYMGISTQAPIYSAMEGLAEGDRFTFRGREITVTAVA